MKMNLRSIYGVVVMAWLLILAAGFTNPAAAADKAVIDQHRDALNYYTGLCLGNSVEDADWSWNQQDAELVDRFHREFDNASDDGEESYQPNASGFFDWLLDLFGWWEDTKEQINEAIGDVYSDEGIPNDPYLTDKYGMNLHDINTMSVEDYKRTLTYAGSWVRVDISTDEVADKNWSFRLDPALENLRTAADSLGVEVNLVINMSGYTNNETGSKYLHEDSPWETKAATYERLAFDLTTHVHELGWNYVIFESWNEPDNHDAGLGIGLPHDDPAFVGAIVQLNNAFANGVKRAHGTTAFSPFMTLNDEKFDLVKDVWHQTQAGFDYFSTHYYDDEAGKVKYYADQTADYLAGRPVIITEHGYQHHKKDTELYRKQAWAFEQGFQHGSESTLEGVMNYVYRSGHGDWVINDGDEFFWKVTHNSKPDFN